MANFKKAFTTQRVMSGLTIGALLVALSASGALGAFYRGVTSTFLGASSYTADSTYDYGYGYDDATGFGYGY
jgi:hypothetical protein